VNDNDYGELLDHVRENPGRRSVFVINVEKGEWIRSLSSPARPIYGPLRVTTIIDPDGETQKLEALAGPVVPTTIVDRPAASLKQRDALADSLGARIDMATAEQRRVEKLKAEAPVGGSLWWRLNEAAADYTVVINRLTLAREALA
jgi:hypothetical protein